ncbi:MAG: hypothetical protein J7518_12435 [Nocardioidaceae bacterium]|nr:hypothetical protein [Nocardioidaceae bacterium]
MTTAPQLELFPLVEPTYEQDASLVDRFAAFHDANPHVADALEHLAAQWLTHRDHVGMKALFERLRWESGIRTEGDPYVLNNNYTAYYARLLIDRRPEWASAFRLRELKSERRAA